MFRELPENARQFLNEVAELSKNYGLSLAHEDAHGGFFVDDYKESNIQWLMGAGRRYSQTMEIWLGNDCTHFDHGRLHYSDGRSVDLTYYYNSSCYGPGSVLMQRSDCDYEDYPVRWHPRAGAIEFYLWMEEIEAITLHNESDHGIYICGYAYLKPGETAVCRRSGKVHRAIFSRYSVVGMAELKAAPEHPELIGQRGMILDLMCKENPALTSWRFVPADQLKRPGEPEAAFDTPFGKKEYQDGCWHLQTDAGEYAVAFLTGEA